MGIGTIEVDRSLRRTIVQGQRVAVPPAAGSRMYSRGLDVGPVRVVDPRIVGPAGPSSMAREHLDLVVHRHIDRGLAWQVLVSGSQHDGVAERTGRGRRAAENAAVADDENPPSNVGFAPPLTLRPQGSGPELATGTRVKLSSSPVVASVMPRLTAVPICTNPKSTGVAVTTRLLTTVPETLIAGARCPSPGRFLRCPVPSW